jgi:UDP-hydrolysing UDP-N-acetyl-D-glucosamine 2-epimerase
MKKIAVFTGTRAEYCLLYGLIKELESAEVDIQLFVGGMHLSPEFGYTVEQIANDGFVINEKLEFLLSSDTAVGITKSLGLALISAAEVLERNQPDIIVVLGDRYESFALAQAAMIAQISVAHIHGGELTEGLIDDPIRHSMTKLANIHFTSTETYRKRVIQLGEQPSCVFNVGAPGLDNIRVLKPMNRSELTASIGFDLCKDFILVTYHPVTLSADGAQKALQNLLTALDDYPEYNIIITYPNADTFGRQLLKLLQKYHSSQAERVLLSPSLGQQRYLSVMKLATLVIGNSSSGIIEAPSVYVATVNVGDRQKGRVAADSVLHCNESYPEIANCMKKALSESHQKLCVTVKNPYGDGKSSKRIVSKLLSYIPIKNRYKTFYDIQ